MQSSERHPRIFGTVSEFPLQRAITELAGGERSADRSCFPNDFWFPRSIRKSNRLREIKGVETVWRQSTFVDKPMVKVMIDGGAYAALNLDKISLGAELGGH